MGVSVTSNGEIVQDVVLAMLDLPVQQTATIFRTGIPVYTSAGQPIHMPQVTSIGTATGHVQEGGTIPQASIATDEVILLPSTVYPLKAMLPITNEARRQSAIGNVEAAFSTALVRRMSDLTDASLWNGAGSGGAPTGLFGIAGFTTASGGTAVGTAITTDDLYSLDADYMLAYGDPEQAVWAMSPANFTNVRKIQDSTGVKILEPSLQAGRPATLLGHPFVVTTHAPNTSIALFDRSRLAIGRGPSTVTILSEFYADTDSVGVRATSVYDIQALTAATICRLPIS